jgi:hypothetical protein
MVTSNFGVQSGKQTDKPLRQPDTLVDFLWNGPESTMRARKQPRKPHPRTNQVHNPSELSLQNLLLLIAYVIVSSSFVLALDHQLVHRAQLIARNQMELCLAQIRLETVHAQSANANATLLLLMMPHSIFEPSKC